jgi:hypothetical protein
MAELLKVMPSLEDVVSGVVGGTSLTSSNDCDIPPSEKQTLLTLGLSVI